MMDIAKPTEAQKGAGNYKKGHMRFQGLDLSIENAMGSQRSGVSPDGQSWSVKMPAHYGYIRGTEGADGDHVDAYVGPHKAVKTVYVIDQVEVKDKAFDEHKALLGYPNLDRALETYVRGFSDGKGADRIGAVTVLSMDDFKKWLRSGRTKAPLARRFFANGGAVTGAFDDLVPQGGAPQAASGLFDDLLPQASASSAPGVFDDLIPSAAPAQHAPSPFYGENPFIPSPEMEKRFEQIKGIETRSGTAPGTWREIDRIANKQQDYGLGNAALQGLTFGFGDEAKAAARAAGGEDYSVALAGEREGLKRYREDHPTKALLAELGGALPTVLIPGLNVARGANLAARVGNAAATGAAYGALYGAGTGEGAPGRAISSGTGGILGGLFGGVVPLGVSAVKGAAGAVDHALGNVGSMVRGAINPEKEASRIVINALERDNPNISDLPGHAVAKMGIAQGRGQPLAVGDLGARHTRAAAKDAARTSIEAKGDLQDLLYGRAGESQGQRLTDFVNHLMGGNTNADARRQALESAAKSQNRAAYERAYRDGDVGVWSPEIAGRLASDAFRGAVRDATRIGSDVAGASGERAVRNPFVFNEAGQGFLRKKADGSVEIPNLRFWDKVKQSLDSQIGRAQRAGDKGEVGRLTQLKNAFVADLDAAVPSYADARRGAAAFFGADDALSAGENFVSMKFGAPETRRALTKMSPAERQLFAEGFASRLVDTIKAIPDNRNAAINAAFNNPAARERLTMALGKRRADQLESFLRVENIMDMMKRAVTGGSDTFENFMRMGVASTLGATASGVATGSTDPVNLAIGAIVGGLTRKGAGVVNEAVARRVGEMLASNDPVIVRQALDRIGRSPALKRGIVDLEGLFTRALGVSLGMHGPRPLGSPGEHVGAYNNGG